MFLCLSINVIFLVESGDNVKCALQNQAKMWVVMMFVGYLFVDMDFISYFCK